MSDAIPCFHDLLGRSDLTRTDVLVYGVIALALRRGSQPSVEEIARAVYQSPLRRRGIQERLHKLERLALIRRELEPGKRTRYVLLGPDFDPDVKLAS